ncbi:MAG: fibronectin type III domain-containing protein [Acidimicrobiaceae bacterium]|nr:fibronectin type III domain-containing protein [Acidimicrobiaceae bacterium]
MQADDRDEDGISIKKNALRLNGGTIADADGNAASLEHRAVATLPSHKVGATAIAASITTPVGSLRISPTRYQMDEGEGLSYRVGLSKQPTGPVTVALERRGPDRAAIKIVAGNDCTAAEITSLTFTTSNWNTAQRVWVCALEDADELHESPRIRHTASGGGYTGAPPVTIRIAVDDNDISGRILVVASGSITEQAPGGTALTELTVTEGGTPKSYDVALSELPAETVNVTLAVGLAKGHRDKEFKLALSGDDLVITGTEDSPRYGLTFTTANGKTAQTVTVVGTDDLDWDDEPLVIDHRAVGYDTNTVAVTVEDDDGAGTTVEDDDGGAATAEDDDSAATGEDLAGNTHSAQNQNDIAAATATATTAGAVPHDWALIPKDSSNNPLVTGGQSFRLLFLTSTRRDATPTDIATYNSFVQQRAAANSDLAGISGQFKVLGSTDSTNARVNTGTAPASGSSYAAGEGVPIYWVSGAKVADDYADFYDNSWDSYAGKDEQGNGWPPTGLGTNLQWIYTGTHNDGTTVNDGHRLGDAGPGLGRLRSNPAHHAISSGLVSTSSSGGLSFYGLSPVLTVDPVVTVPPNWKYTPSGFDAGDTFRLIFMTSTTTAAAGTNQVTYINHVKNSANTNDTLKPYKAQFSALVSTQYHDARDLTRTNTAKHGAGEPIYWLGGAKVADDYADFYSAGGWDSQVARFESGETVTGLENRWIWTGSNRNGTKKAGKYLSADHPTAGKLAGTIGGASKEIDSGHTRTKTDKHHVYGMSPVFKVPAAATSTATAKPAKPTGFTATAGNKQVTLGWDDPSNQSITKYQYQYRPRSDTDSGYGDWTDITPKGPDTTSYTVTGLTNGTDYSFRIRARTSAGFGPVSNRKEATPSAPRVEPAKPTGFTATAGNTRVTLGWDDPSNLSITKYQYRQKVGAAKWGSWTEISPSGADTISYTVVGLTNRTEYSFRIRARTSAGWGPESDTKTATPLRDGAPAMPTGLTATPGVWQVALGWTGPADSGDSPITKYQVMMLGVDSGGSPVSGQTPEWVDVPYSNADTTSHTVICLPGGLFYIFRIRAVNGSGPGHSTGWTSRVEISEPTSTSPPFLACEPGDPDFEWSWEVSRAAKKQKLFIPFASADGDKAARITYRLPKAATDLGFSVKTVAHTDSKQDSYQADVRRVAELTFVGGDLYKQDPAIAGLGEKGYFHITLTAAERNAANTADVATTDLRVRIIPRPKSPRPVPLEEPSLGSAPTGWQVVNGEANPLLRSGTAFDSHVGELTVNGGWPDFSASLADGDSDLGFGVKVDHATPTVWVLYDGTEIPDGSITDGSVTVTVTVRDYGGRKATLKVPVRVLAAGSAIDGFLCQRPAGVAAGALPTAAQAQALTVAAQKDCNLLLSAKSALEGANTNRLDWGYDLTVDRWRGVTISSESTVPADSNRVVSLRVNNPDDADKLAGTVPAQLGSLSELTVLHLADNKLTGTIPQELKNLVDLERLYLCHNKLTGTIPDWLGTATLKDNLDVLCLSNNELDGAIPTTLGSIPKLKVLGLSQNNLTGTIPAELGGLAELLTLELHDNKLTGTIPAERWAASPS